MPSREQRTYTSEISELRRMSAWWCEWCASIGLGVDVQDRGELCLNEVTANIALHGGRPSAITITLESEPDAVRMTIADNGEPFDPVTHPAAALPRSLAEATPGGLGLHIIRASADGLVYRRIGLWNELILTLSRSRS